MNFDRTPASVLAQYQTTVRPMAERYILPTRSHADVVVGGIDRLECSVAAVHEHIASRVPEIGQAGLPGTPAWRAV